MSTTQTTAAQEVKGEASTEANSKEVAKWKPWTTKAALVSSSGDIIAAQALGSLVDIPVTLRLGINFGGEGLRFAMTFPRVNATRGEADGFEVSHSRE